MSSYDDIPTEIQIEIITRLDPKSLIRFSCVSKQLNSLIHSSKFVKDYTRNSRLVHTQQQQQQQRLFFVQKGNAKRYIDDSYRWFVDDDAFPQNKSIPFLPNSIAGLYLSKVAGTSDHGLICLLGSFKKKIFTNKAVIWNPMIRKSVCIDLPNLSRDSNIGFGVCPKTCDPKIVRIDPIRTGLPNLLPTSNIGFGVCPKTYDPKIVRIDPIRTDLTLKLEDTNWQVEVFTLSSGEWRRIIPSGNLPAKWLEVHDICNDPVVVDGFMYWLVFEEAHIETLVSFDLTSEVFKRVRLPHKLLLSCGKRIQIFKFGESLAIFARKRNLVYKVWTMENGAFKKLLTIDGYHLSVSKPPVFRSNGQLILRDTDLRLLLYHPDSNKINDLGICGDHRSSYVSSIIESYVSFITESLLLLDQSLTERSG